MKRGGCNPPGHSQPGTVNNRTDSELVQAARTGDKLACGQLLERHWQRALGLAMRMVQHPQTAQDLAQEAMVEAYLSLDSLRQPESFASWLYGIVLNVCRSYLRNRSTGYLSLEAMAGGMVFYALPFTGSEPDPHEIVEMRELHELVLRAVNTLSSRNREATLLFYFDQLTVQEIAALLGISVAAVKGRLHKSRKQLREHLAPIWAASDKRTIEKTRAKEGKTMVKVTVADVVRQSGPGHYVVILLDEAGWRVLPIWIGEFEGTAIAMQVLERAAARPLTYAFIANLLGATGAVLEEVRVETLREITFYAIAKLRSGERTWEVDARPSDAIALALHMHSPIYVADEIMEKAGATVPEAYRTTPLGKGLTKIGSEIDEKMQEAERKLQEAKTSGANRAEEEQMEARQKLFASLFGEAD